MVKIKQDTVLGLVFFGGLILLLYGTAVLSNFSLKPKQVVEVYFPDARGLKVGDQVFVLGTPYGIVSDVRFEPSNIVNRIKVKIQLNKELTLRVDYRIVITAASLLGGKIIQIEPGKSEKIFQLGSALIVGEAPASPLEALGEWFSKGSTKESLTAILEGLAQIVNEVRSGNGTLGKLLKDSALYDNAKAFVEGLNKAIADARAGKGSLGKFIVDPKLYDDAQGFFASAKEAVDKAQKGDGTIAMLLGDSEFKKKVKNTVDNLERTSEDLRKGVGLAGKLISDPDTSKRFDKILGNVDEATAALNKGDGLVAALLHDKQMRDQASVFVSNLKKISTNLAGKESTLGRLINDGALADDIERIVKQISRSIEDVREAAPVQTFFSVFAGVFQ
ncbi:MAG TPA: MCE family protein [Planctomycetes bacterium]|nr:MCE family protein [Planctomycetota bacterium]